MRSWEQLFAKAENSGVYPMNEDAFPDVSKSAAHAGLALFNLNLAGVTGKTGFLAAAAKALHFPGYFGHNWDAFEDCLTDLSWLEAKGYVLLIKNLSEFSHKAPTEMLMARTILEDAATFWKEHGVRFFVALPEEGPK